MYTNLYFQLMYFHFQNQLFIYITASVQNEIYNSDLLQWIGLI